MKKNIVTIAIGIVIILLVTVAIYVIANEDKKAPVITFNIPTGREITYDSGQDKQTLIQYVKAVDGKDGDVSDSIIIEQIYISTDLSTAKVIYVARDKSNNIAKINHDFKYIASQEEIDSLTLAKEKATSDAAALAQSTNVLATVATTKAVENTTVSPEKPVLTLSQNELTIAVGGSFNGTSYVKDITDDKDNKETLFRRIIVVGDYNTKTAGDYTISIYCTDTDGNTSNVEKFILHVGAKQVETVTKASTVAPANDPPANDPPADDPPADDPPADEPTTKAATQPTTKASTQPTIKATT